MEKSQIRDTGIFLPNDIPCSLQNELKNIQDPSEKLFKIHKFGTPDSKLTLEDIKAKVFYRESIALLTYFDLA